MFRFRSAVLGAMSLLVVPALVHSQGKKSQFRTPVRSADPVQNSVKIAAVFRDPDRTAFRDYFVTQKLAVTPLPPGIAKNVARGKPLPPGIAKKVFPRRLVVGRPVDADIFFIMVGHNMVAMRNGVVVDIMVNVFP